MAEFAIRSVFLTLGQVSLALLALAVAAGLATIPTGSTRVAGVVGATIVVLGASYLIRSLRRQAIIVDGDRLGWRRGLSAEVRGWTDLRDVEAATVAKASSSISRKRTDVILWTRVGGMRGVDAILLRPQLSEEFRTRLDVRSGRSEPLHPFLVPFTAMRADGRAALTALLGTYGLMPS